MNEKEFILRNTNFATMEDLEFMGYLPIDVVVKLMKQYTQSKLSLPIDTLKCTSCGGKLQIEIKEMTNSDILKAVEKKDFNEWYKLNEQEINIELAESGADREMDFDSEKEFEIRYQKYLEGK